VGAILDVEVWLELLEGLQTELDVLVWLPEVRLEVVGVMETRLDVLVWLELVDVIERELVVLAWLLEDDTELELGAEGVLELVNGEEVALDVID
jgi:hypothetical protein